MLPLNALAVLAGQLLGIAFAAGLNLYATVAVLGTASRLGLVPPLPPGLRGLTNALVIASAAALFCAELVIEKLPVLGGFWTGAHTLIRPVAAALLTFVAFATQPLEQRLALAAATGLIAFAAHGAQTGLRVVLASARGPRSALHTAVAAVTLDAIAIATALTALLNPAAAGVLGAGAIVLLALAGPRLWRAAIFGGHALIARVGGFFGHRGWKTGRELPRRVRLAALAAPLGGAEARGTRIAVIGLPRTAAYRTGWLVFDAGGACFIHATPLTARRTPLPPVAAVEVRPGPMVDVLRVIASTPPLTLFLLKDGPSPANVTAELRGGS